MSSSAGSPRHLDNEARCRLARTLLRRGVRQLGVLRAASAGITQAPNMDDRALSIERAREELLQLERAAGLYAEVTGGDLLSDAEQVLSDVPSPASWVEAATAQLLLCLASQVELETGCDTGGEPSERHALLREAERVHAARAALDEAKAFSTELDVTMRAGTSRWLPMALCTLEDDDAREHYTRALERLVEPSSLGLPH